MMMARQLQAAVWHPPDLIWKIADPMLIISFARSGLSALQIA